MKKNAQRLKQPCWSSAWWSEFINKGINIDSNNKDKRIADRNFFTASRMELDACRAPRWQHPKVASFILLESNILWFDFNPCGADGSQKHRHFVSPCLKVERDFVGKGEGSKVNLFRKSLPLGFFMFLQQKKVDLKKNKSSSSPWGNKFLPKTTSTTELLWASLVLCPKHEISPPPSDLMTPDLKLAGTSAISNFAACFFLTTCSVCHVTPGSLYWEHKGWWVCSGWRQLQLLPSALLPFKETTLFCSFETVMSQWHRDASA